MKAVQALGLAAAAFGAAGATQKPNLVFMLQDDCGWHDTSVFGDQSPETRAATHNMTALADEGVRLDHHYVHWHCSPTRRSFLSGRLPLHHGEELSNVATDELDLRWRWVSDMLAEQGYVGHWYGKGHTGYKSMAHLPAAHGFNGGSVLFLGGAGSYYTLARFNGTNVLYTKAANPKEYSTDLFGSLALQAVQKHDLSKPLFLYLPWQAVHAPYDLPPAYENKTTPPEDLIRVMLTDVDRWVGAITNALKERSMWDNTLIVYTADNGGTQDPWGSTKVWGGNNYPLRGAKHSNWQGGMRTMTFISGGLVPQALRGTTNNGTYHVVDWYPTFCRLAGGTNCTDASPEKPLPVDPSDPSKDIYRGAGAECWPSVDGIDIWDAITKDDKKAKARPYLWLSEQVMIKDGRYKIVVAQQNPKVTNSGPMPGWRNADGNWTTKGLEIDGPGCGLAFRNRDHFVPCLFDLNADEREENDLSASKPRLLENLWTELNTTQLSNYSSRTPAALLGVCDETCAAAHWKAEYGASLKGPICGVCKQ
eukprot:Hpha_TRINITY_DN27519_c0_g1::TRINITY_DN27519_c0_g1_i1::g.86225::m.86225